MSEHKARRSLKRRRRRRSRGWVTLLLIAFAMLGAYIAFSNPPNDEPEAVTEEEDEG